MRPVSLACLLAVISLAAVAAPTAPHYELGHRFLLGGDGGWDYVIWDPTGKRLFVGRSTRVQVLDVEKGALIAEIPNTPGVHGVALAQEFGKGYTSNGQEGTSTVFDLKTLKETARIKLTGEGPDTIIYDPATRSVLTLNGRSNNITVIDPKTDRVTATIPLPGRPEEGKPDGSGRVYVNIEDQSEIAVVDVRAAKVISTWSLAPCEGPSALALDVAHRRAFSGCDNKLMAVSDLDQGKVVATAPVGDGVDGDGFDPGTQLAFTSNGRDGTLTVIHEDSPDKYTVVETTPTQKYARTMALDPASHHIYLVTADLKVTPAPAGATGQAARPHREVLPDSFTVLVMELQDRKGK